MYYRLTDKDNNYAYYKSNKINGYESIDAYKCSRLVG